MISILSPARPLLRDARSIMTDIFRSMGCGRRREAFLTEHGLDVVAVWIS
jgi:hypothetical protein